MLVGVREEVPGELDGLTAQELKDKLVGAFSAASRELLKGRKTADGEVHALAELQAELERAFGAELDRIRAEVMAEVEA